MARLLYHMSTLYGLAVIVKKMVTILFLYLSAKISNPHSYSYPSRFFFFFQNWKILSMGNRKGSHHMCMKLTTCTIVKNLFDIDASFIPI